LFRYSIYVLLLMLFGVALFADLLLRLIAPSSYAGAAPLVPVICLAFAFYSTEMHFKVPALLAKRTLSLVPGHALAAILNVGLNFWLLPLYGIVAAAWILVLTYAVFAGVSLLQNRRIDRYDYPLAHCAAIVAGMIASVVALQALPDVGGPVAVLVLPAIIWCAWASGLVYPMATSLMALRGQRISQ
jgi:O-antigen/teichoic acid export membrane protein